MVTLQTFLVGLLVTSTLTGLVTEAVKNILVEHEVKYRANTLAGVVATVLSVFIGIGYVIIAGLPFSSQIVVCLIAQIFMSWLCAMVGYDKVLQAIEQFKMGKK
jgi:hypothetical protein